MAHYAILDNNNIVTQVIVGRDENDLAEGVTDWETYYGEKTGATVKRTSYNTHANQHATGGTPYRGNFAGIGHIYDTDNDVFYQAQPFASWTLDTSSWTWQAPVIQPDDGYPWVWNESEQEWGEYQYDAETDATVWVTATETPGA